MPITYEEVIPTPIENATVKKAFLNGVHKTYTIAPNEGYVLHDKGFDTPILDEETLEETGEVILGYRTSTASCRYDYDFNVNPNEYYAVPINDVPADQIFGDVTPPVEVMKTGDNTETE